MKKRIVSMILVLVMCVSLTFVGMAAPQSYVIDECDYLADGEIGELNRQAQSIYDKTGVGVFYVFTKAESLSDYDISSFLNGLEHYVVMMENDASWYTFYGGMGNLVDETAESVLRNAYDAADTYVAGVAGYMTEADKLFSKNTQVTVQTEAAAESETVVSTEEALFFYDDAKLISEADGRVLNKKLANVSKKHNAQVIVATISSTEGGDIDEFVEFLYDLLEFGYGENRDGVLMLVSMEPREYRILSNGFAAEAIDQEAIESIGEALTSDLSDGKYNNAFEKFAVKCDYYLNGYLNGFPFDFAMNLGISVVIGVAAGAIVAFVLKGQLKTVRKQEKANVYIKSGSVQITLQNDVFMYSDVKTTRKESSKSSSDSDSSRNVGGGSF